MAPVRTPEDASGPSTSGEPAGASRPDASLLRAGEQVLLIDRKDRRYLVALTPGGSFQTHAGNLAHDELIGRPEGHEARSDGTSRFWVFRPTLSDLVLKQPRGAQVIYPKDLGPILVLADLSPGVEVLETGLGSGALSATLLRHGARVTGIEIREDFLARARANVATAAGEDGLERYDARLGDSYDELPAGRFDRVLLDLPEPWRVIERLDREVLVPGGILVAYTPSLVQVMRLRTAMARAGFALCETVEVLQRSWHVDGASVRPDHRMVAHTGFLTHGRYAADPPSGSGRATSPAAGEAPTAGDLWASGP